MGHRGRERLVTCEKCGRMVRKDKAVFIEKPVFTNPLERKDVAEGQPYTRVITREVAYCPGCGKHLRVYEKKKRQLERDRERAQERERYSRYRERPSEHAPHQTPQSETLQSETPQSETQGAQPSAEQGAEQNAEQTSSKA